MTEEGTRGKLGRIGLWVVTVAFAVPMILAGSTKFFASATWLPLFESWGYPPSLSYPVGALEIAGAVAALVPRYATYGAALVAAIMVVAAGTLLLHPGELTPTVPIVNVVAFTTIAVARAKDRRKS